MSTVLLSASGSTGPDVTSPAEWVSSSSTVPVIVTIEQQARKHGLIPRAWQGAMKAFAVAILPLADVYDPLLRRNLLTTGGNYVVLVGEHLPGDVYDEPESIFAMRPERATLWLPSVPILPRRRPFIPSWDLSDDDE